MYPTRPIYRLGRGLTNTLPYGKETMETVVVFSFTLEADKEQAQEATGLMKTLMRDKYGDRYSEVNEVYMEKDQFEHEVGKAALSMIDPEETS